VRKSSRLKPYEASAGRIGLDTHRRFLTPWMLTRPTPAIATSFVTGRVREVFHFIRQSSDETECDTGVWAGFVCCNRRFGRLAQERFRGIDGACTCCPHIDIESAQISVMSEAPENWSTHLIEPRNWPNCRSEWRRHDEAITLGLAPG